MQKKRLAIISTHPIQYNAPLFRLLAQTIDLKVFYTWSQAQESVADKEFGRKIVWDIPLLEGYDYEFIENISNKPKQQFNGLVNPELIPAIDHWHPDAVLVFGWNFSSHFKAMRHFHGRIPVWFRGDSTLLDEKHGLKTFLRRIVLRYVYSYVDRAFYVGENNKQYFIAHGFKEHQLSFAPHAIDNARFGSKEAVLKGKQWRNQLGYTDNDIVLLYAGKISERKNIIPFTQQFVNYIDNTSESRLKILIVGNGDSETLLPIHNSIQRIEFQNQSTMPALNYVADIVVLPSSYGETWGLVINEAMAAGKPVIVTNKVGCAIDLVEQGKNGFYFNLVSPNNNFKMFEKIETANLKEIGSRNKTIIKNWSHQAIAESLIKQL